MQGSSQGYRVTWPSEVNRSGFVTITRGVAAEAPPRQNCQPGRRRATSFIPILASWACPLTSFPFDVNLPRSDQRRYWRATLAPASPRGQKWHCRPQGACQNGFP